MLTSSRVFSTNHLAVLLKFLPGSKSGLLRCTPQYRPCENMFGYFECKYLFLVPQTSFFSTSSLSKPKDKYSYKEALCSSGSCGQLLLDESDVMLRDAPGCSRAPSSPNPRGEAKNRVTCPFFSLRSSGLCGHLTCGGPLKLLEATLFHRHRHRRALLSRCRHPLIFKHSAGLGLGLTGRGKWPLSEPANHLCTSMTSFLQPSDSEKRDFLYRQKLKQPISLLFEILAAQPGFHPNWAGQVRHHIVAEQENNLRKCDEAFIRGRSQVRPVLNIKLVLC